MTSLAEKLSDIVGAAFEAQGLPAELGLVRVSDRPDLCQFQCNGAMAAAAKQSNALLASKDSNNASGVASKAKKNPREVAQNIIETLKHRHSGEDRNLSGKLVQADKWILEQIQDDIFSKIEIAGPGFINLDVTDAFLSSHISENAQNEEFGVAKSGEGQTIILDYGGPNIAKAMHVGHLRSSIIGDSVRRICLAAGYKAIGDVHMGDWGTPMGMILSELEERGIMDEPVTMEQLEKLYPEAAQACKDSEERMEKAREATKKLQEGDEAYTAKWREFIDVSIAGMKKNFDALGVHFDEWKGEADAHPFIEPMIEELKAKSWAIDSDGALVMNVEQNDDKKEVPPLILLKSDGAVLYGTTDMATIIDRAKTHAPNEIVYVVDQRQSLHFEQVFRGARKGGLVDESVALTFAGFGTMNGTDGKPFKTRAGGVMKLEDLISMAVDKAQSRLDEADLAKDASDEERAAIAHKVAIAAIKFADLQNQRHSDYVFDLDRMTQFEGKTGPYMLYQAVRIKSLLRKAEEQNISFGETPQFVIQDADRSLALLLSEFPDHFANALKNYTPHVLCDYAFKLAQEFSSFYGNCHILSEENEGLRTSRLQLCQLTYKQLEFVLGLLGIEIPERM